MLEPSKELWKKVAETAEEIRIEVGEKAEKYSRTAPQNIWIHYRDIGMLNDVKEEFDIPSIETFYGAEDEILFDDGLEPAV